MATSSKSAIDELLLYEADDEASAKEASCYTTSQHGSFWKVSSIGVKGIRGIQLAINNAIHIKQLTFCCRRIDEDLSQLDIPEELFGNTHCLMFMENSHNPPGKEDPGRDLATERKVIENGRRFFAGKAGVVGISFASCSEECWSPWSKRRHTFFHLDHHGRVKMRKVVTPLTHLKCG